MAEETNLGVDDAEGRDQAFFARLSISRRFYRQAVDAAVAHAVNPAIADATPSPWFPQGARNIGGRTRCLAQSPRDPSVMYAGSAQGGVFRSVDAGDTWAPIGAAQDSFPVGAIAIAPSDPNTVYVGSGEPGIRHSVVGGAVVAREEFAAGRGFFRVDATVSPPTVTQEVPSALSSPGTAGAANSFARIVVDPAEPRRCWMASNTGLWRREPGPVFHREVFPAALAVRPPVGTAATDVVLVKGWDSTRATTYRIYAAFGSFGIFRGVFDPAAPAAGIVWDPILSSPNLPVPSSAAGMTWDRIKLAVCPANPRHVYAIAENPALSTVLSAYHSRDAGNTWTARAAPNLGSQVWVNLYIEVHPDNPAIVVAGAVDLARSRNFGATWETMIDSTNFDRGDHALHADQHAALFDVADPRHLWVCNDGGIAMTPDIVASNPHTSRNWRKRSHGIFAAQFNDISVSPRFPFMMGGGLQDNGTYITFGGETWHYINGGDGGLMAFEVDDPRSFVSTWQGQGAGVSPLAINRARVISGTSVNVSGARSLVNVDLDPPNDVFATSAADIENLITDPPHGATFIGVVEHHPSTAGHFLVGRLSGGAYVTTDRGANYAQLGFTAVQFGAGDVTALAYGIQSGPNADWWVGSSQGVVLLGINAPPAATAWTVMALPASAAGALISRIAVHPRDDTCVAVATAGTGGPPPQQGRVYLTVDRGAHWSDVTGLASVGVPVGPAAAVPLQALPPCPITSLVFDPQPARGDDQVLYAGTLAGVYVIRNLPRRSPPAVPAAFNPQWFTFNASAAFGPLPLTLVKDLKVVSLPGTGPVRPNVPESVDRHRLIAAMYGRGIYVCDITRNQPPGIPTGGPTQRLYIRQTVIENGLTYPRPTPATLNAAPAAGGAQPKLGGDPRCPTGPAPDFPIRFTDRQAFDIRVDTAPYQFFEDVMDGVEFDEDLRTQPLAPGERNVIYVQVHSSGWQSVLPVNVHLYFAEAPVPPADPPLPNLHADFWAHFTDDPLPTPAAAVVAPAATWQRAGKPVTLLTVGPNQPAVARFDWVPPVALASTDALAKHVALLAACTSPLDPLPPNPPVVMATLIRNERRVALRVTPTTRFVPDLFIRDGLDDDGALGGVAFGGRSPDIIVVAAAPVDPAQDFKDLGDDRAADRVRGNGGANVVYVRVHNRKEVDSAADVELFWALPNAPVTAAPGQAGPPFDSSKWQVIAPVEAVNVTVPARGSKLARFDFNAAPAPEPGFPNALAFIALIKSHDSLDPEPVRAGVDTQDEFWRLFLELANSNNAALRALRYA